MKISVVVAVYNGEKTLENTIKSFSQQTYDDKELIVFDGGSSDSTVSIIEKYQSNIHYWESRVDRGIAHAWNKALKKVNGEWVVFLGSDDIFHDENVLNDMSGYLKESKHDFVYGEMKFDDGPYKDQLIGKQANLKDLKTGMCIPHTATFNRFSFLQEAGEFDETFRIAIDYELLLRKKSLSFKFIKRPIVIMGCEGVSSKLVTQTLKEFSKAQIKHKVTPIIIIKYTFYKSLYKKIVFKMVSMLIKNIKR